MHDKGHVPGAHCLLKHRRKQPPSLSALSSLLAGDELWPTPNIHDASQEVALRFPFTEYYLQALSFASLVGKALVHHIP